MLLVKKHTLQLSHHIIMIYLIKLYSTEYVSEHLSLGLKGNQVVGTNVDSTEYF